MEPLLAPPSTTRVRYIIAYTAPPFRLVHRGLGELCVALGFGPIMVLGASYVEEQRFSFEAFYVSLPVAILIALVLYANEIPDRPGDAQAGKRTLPVRWSKQAVLTGYAVASFQSYKNDTYLVDSRNIWCRENPRREPGGGRWDRVSSRIEKLKTDGVKFD